MIASFLIELLRKSWCFMAKARSSITTAITRSITTGKPDEELGSEPSEVARVRSPIVREGSFCRLDLWPRNDPSTPISQHQLRPIENKRVKVIKKPRSPGTIETEITELEKQIAELSEAMTKPEVARDITRLVKVNYDYQKAESRLAELMDEWERAETPETSKR